VCVCVCAYTSVQTNAVWTKMSFFLQFRCELTDKRKKEWNLIIFFAADPNITTRSNVYRESPVVSLCVHTPMLPNALRTVSHLCLARWSSYLKISDVLITNSLDVLHPEFHRITARWLTWIRHCFVLAVTERKLTTNLGSYTYFRTYSQ